LACDAIFKKNAHFFKHMGKLDVVSAGKNIRQNSAWAEDKPVSDKEHVSSFVVVPVTGANDLQNIEGDSDRIDQDSGECIHNCNGDCGNREDEAVKINMIQSRHLIDMMIFWTIDCIR
jgi:hypothetical protein